MKILSKNADNNFIRDEKHTCKSFYFIHAWLRFYQDKIINSAVKRLVFTDAYKKSTSAVDICFLKTDHSKQANRAH